MDLVVEQFDLIGVLVHSGVLLAFLWSHEVILSKFLDAKLRVFPESFLQEFHKPIHLKSSLLVELALINLGRKQVKLFLRLPDAQPLKYLFEFFESCVFLSSSKVRDGPNKPFAVEFDSLSQMKNST